MVLLFVAALFLAIGKLASTDGNSEAGGVDVSTVDGSIAGGGDPPPDVGASTLRVDAGDSGSLNTTVSGPTSTSDGVQPAEVQPISSQPTAPIRAAFFYPWFPHAWEQGGVDPFTNFTPSLGRYSSSQESTIRTQLDLAVDANLDAFIASWWGKGHHTDKALPALLDTTVGASSGSHIKWSIYFEPEGQGDPSVSELRDDLDYLADQYFDHPGYLFVEGRPVVFVWADPNDGADMAKRWAEAVRGMNVDPYIVLKVFSGFEDVANQPDSWHQYGPAKPYSEHLPYSATVSPGFWLKGGAVRLQRDIERFADHVNLMANSGAFWHLITSWNEWGEGTSIEPAEEFGRSYIDVLGGSGSSSPSATTRSTISDLAVQPPSTYVSGSDRPRSVRFSAAGDMGANEKTSASLELIRRRGTDFHLALGDLSYDDVGSEMEWCSYIKAAVPSTPVQILVGNHEDDDRHDGHIGRFVDCMPDAMGSTGSYGTQYHFDVDDLARIIMIGADNDVDGVDYDYSTGTVYYRWLSDAIDGARSEGLPWVIVGMHKVCLSAGKKPCEIGTEVMDLLIEKRVDLVIHGHEHTYQRSKQVGCVAADRYLPSCVIDHGSDGVYGRGDGLVWVVSGAFGGAGLTDINTGDPELSYLAEWMGANHAEAGRGYLEINLSANELLAEFIGSTSDYSDSFVVR